MCRALPGVVQLPPEELLGCKALRQAGETQSAASAGRAEILGGCCQAGQSGLMEVGGAAHVLITDF